MSLPPLLSVGALLVAVALPCFADPPAPPDKKPALDMPVGRWTVEFANGVTETCEILRDGTASVSEPQRTSRGKVTLRDGAFVIVFEDDRAERWTPVGRRMVVEHWFPASQIPSATPVLGIAERTP